MDNVHRITAGDASPGSVLAMLHEATSDVAAGELKCQQAVLLTLDTDGGVYNINWLQVGMKGSEIIALLEGAKQIVLQKMGF